MKFTDYATRTRGEEWIAPPAVVPKDDTVLTREFLYNTVAGVFDIEAVRLQHPTRGPARVAFARQVAMYLAHVGCELSLTAVGRMFERDRSTVAHACRRIEDKREQPQFNRAVGMMERSVRAIVKASSALRRDLDLAERSVR